MLIWEPLWSLLGLVLCHRSDWAVQLIDKLRWKWNSPSLHPHRYFLMDTKVSYSLIDWALALYIYIWCTNHMDNLTLMGVNMTNMGDQCYRCITSHWANKMEVTFFVFLSCSSPYFQNLSIEWVVWRELILHNCAESGWKINTKQTKFIFGYKLLTKIDMIMLNLEL